MTNSLEFVNHSLCAAWSKFQFAGKNAHDHAAIYAQFALSLSEACDAAGTGRAILFLKRGFGRVLACDVENSEGNGGHHRRITDMHEIARHGNRAGVVRITQIYNQFQKRSIRLQGVDRSRRAFRFVLSVLLPRLEELMSCSADDRTLEVIVRYVVRQASRFASGKSVSVVSVSQRIDLIKKAGYAFAPNPVASAA